MRDACLLAVAVARDGELAQPRQPAPLGVRQVVGFARMSKPAYDVVRKVVDDDAAFRARVAAVAHEAEVGRAGWLWLHRPDGWDADPVWEAGDDHDRGRGQARLRRERDGAEAAAARHRSAAQAAEAARDRALEQLVAARAEAARAGSERDDLAARLAARTDERATAVRALKASEAELAAARRDLRLSREATRQAEAELLAERAAGSRTEAASRPEVVEPADHEAVRDAVAAASVAAADLQRALTTAADALGARPADPGGATAPGGKARRGRRPAAPRPSALPPGIPAGTAEADRVLVTAGRAALVVDGYNVARAAWSGLSPEEERRRTVALLEEVHARFGAPVTVVFDGADQTVAPVASRTLRVRFSPSGVTADQVISELLAGVDPGQPVVVVSSDREVADDATRQGAHSLGARAFLAAAGR